MAQGFLQVDVVSDANNFPIEDANVSIARTEEPGNVIEQITTNSSGQTENVTLETPPLELSLTPQDLRPYAEYTIRITAPGFEPVVISGTEVLADATALQNVRMIPLAEETRPAIEDIIIPDHTLYGTFPPKIAESEIKPMNENGAIVANVLAIMSFTLNRVYTEWYRNHRSFGDRGVSYLIS